MRRPIAEAPVSPHPRRVTSYAPSPDLARSRIAPGAYTSVAKALHWILAALIILQLVGGIVMGKLPEDASYASAVFTIHQSNGLTILALSLFRLVWRLTHKPPPLPEGTKAWDRLFARATQAIFYVLMIAVPLAGWLMVSGHEGSVNFFFLFPVPHLPAVGSHELWEEAHELLAFGFIGLIPLHIAGALKHRYVDRDGVLARMLPGRREAAPTH
nr:cytochrome b [Parvularcula dongshanensis]